MKNFLISLNLLEKRAGDREADELKKRGKHTELAYGNRVTLGC